MTEMQLINYS